MKHARARRRWAGILATVLMVSFYFLNAGVYGLQKSSNDDVKARADIIRIDSMKAFGKLERPPVTFFHQKHTEALEKKNKDCATCHLSENDRLSPKYKRLKDTDRQEVMDLYHNNCIVCHRKTAAADEKSGPVVCGECHKDTVEVVSSWQPIGMDKSLHYRHSKAQKEKCEQCHHEYDAKTKKLFYAKGKEGTCRYCHGEKTEENRISMRLASHLACIDCHRKTWARAESAGPFTCNGCHEPAEQKTIEVVKEVPRMKRNQPDIVFVKTAKTNFNPVTRMSLVPFDHKAHENYNNSCRVCHHADLNACVQCHTLPGAKEGNYVNLEQAMHRLNNEQSCQGCHEIKQQEQRCAGCHASIPNSRIQDQATCLACHMTPPVQMTAETPTSQRNALAARMLDSRYATMGTYSDEAIPETVEIKLLSETYEGVKLPHRKILHALQKNIGENKLVNYFHSDKGTVCQGCHHNSPASQNPPKCASCHGKPFDAKEPLRPGLMAAYHRQCMQCHQEMGIEKPESRNCTDCHKKKG